MKKEFIDYFENRFASQIRSHRVLKEEPGTSCDFPMALDDSLAGVLRDKGVRGLYSHQAEAYESIRKNRDTVIVSQTASGKTLSFLLPLLDEYVKTDNPFSVLLLYPTKALSRDQEGTLGSLMQTAGIIRSLGTFDGDTPREERSRICKSADFVITNPDMLHSGILPNHNRKWKDILSRLRYIVVDEVHSYRGAFGSHVANIFRRLIRICAIHGSHPVFICSSATVGNPGAHVRNLFGRDFTIIDRDGSPRPERHLYMVNPEQKISHGGALYRKGTASISIHLLRDAVKRGIPTICFCRARQEVERLYRAVTDGHPELKKVIQPYRGGLLPNERRRLEKDIFNGKIKGVISTNALELGIDIGDLELCILSGHPGSIASFWQQAGRVGRKKGGAVIIYVAKDTPVDQYLVHHPEFVSSTPIEEAWLNADNPYIVLQHLPCAAFEHPLRSEESEYSSKAAALAVDLLKEDKTIVPYQDVYRYALEEYPARSVNIRGMTDYNIDIYEGSEVIGEIDPIGAMGSLYKDAIYQHLGRRYMSMELDLEKKLCRVELVDVDYYTEAVWDGSSDLTETEEKTDLHGNQLSFGPMEIKKQPKLYKKIRERSLENIGYGPITLPPFKYDTTGFCLLARGDWRKEIDAANKKYLGSALYGLSYILRRMAPGLCMGDINDIETDVSLAEAGAEDWKSALYLYDRIEGGVGYAEKIFEKAVTAFRLCLQIITECECEAGCPACVPPLPPGIENEELAQFLIESNGAVECTRSFLVNLVSGEISLPEIRSLRRELPAAVDPIEEDPETVRLKTRLGRAAGIIKKRRERKH